jgi:hypothetical protein
MSIVLPQSLLELTLPSSVEDYNSRELLSSLAELEISDKSSVMTFLERLPIHLSNCYQEESDTQELAHGIEESIEVLVTILVRYSSNMDICIISLNITQWVAFRYSMGESMCVALLRALQVRMGISRDYIADEEYKKGFIDLIPNKIRGCDGLWRHVFDYHYPAAESGAKAILLCLHVIRDLTRSNTVQNRNSLISAGACEIITSLFTSYATNPLISHECCKAVIVLAHAGRDRLISSNACAGVVKAVALHGIISSNALNGCRAIYALSIGDVLGMDGLINAGACLTLVALLTLHLKDKNIVREGCLAVHRLSFSSPQNRVAFANAGFCEVLMLIYRFHGQSNEINVKGLIRNFVLDNVHIRNRFISLGAEEVISF